MKNEIEMMRVWRVPPLGKLEIEANGQRYGNIQEISDARLKQRVMAAIGELITFAGGYEALADIGLAPALVPPAAAKQAVAEPDSDELARQQAAFLANLEAQGSELKTRPPRGGFSLFNKPEPVTNAEPLVAFTESGDVKPVGEQPRPQSIAEQIDVILQKHLAASPDLAQRRVHLEQNPAGGLGIRVDGVYFEKPADIPDKKVQLAIKMAVQEWNRS